MNLQQAVLIPITWFLGGIVELRKATKIGDKINCCSPFRDDDNPSYSISIAGNVSHDFATGETRDIVQCVEDYYRLSNTSEALRKIEELLKVYPINEAVYYINPSQNTQKQTSPTFGLEKQRSVSNKNKNYPEGFKTDCSSIDINRDSRRGSEDFKTSNVEIIEVKELFYFPIKNYVQKVRRIDIETANLYLKEIHFKIKGNKYFGVCHRNRSDGYEVRGCGSKNFKMVIGNKDITFIEGGDKENKTILVFEGIFDFLSYLEMKGIRKFTEDVVILNTCAIWERGVELIQESGKYSRVELYLDNDVEGRNTAEKIKRALSGTFEVLDKSDLYSGYKDLGEWWASDSKK